MRYIRGTVVYGFEKSLLLHPVKKRAPSFMVQESEGNKDLKSDLK